MKAAILGFLAETPVHPGAGRGMGVVDLPVAREASTDYPVLVGSSLKGALRDKAGATNVNRDKRFGKQDHAGDLLVSDARLLLLPVRSLTGQYRWATCPHLIERYSRDLARAKHTPLPSTPQVQSGSVLTEGEGELFLEERQFNIDGQPLPQGLVDAIGKLILHNETRERLGKQIAILCNDDFSWFARYGLTIQARNTLDDETKQSKNLWYEETLPPDTIMYGLILGRNSDAIEVLQQLFPENDPYLQIGGNETVGQGWFAVKMYGHDVGGGQ